MRLIDADALLNTLQELFDKREKEARFTGNREVMVTWNDAIYYIKIAPTIEPKWIPVTERLPINEFEEGRKNRTVYDLYPCLVTRYATHTDEPRTRTYVCKSYFDGEDFMLHGGYAPDEGSDTENTLAWMPLPDRYREETEDATQR